MRHSIYLSNILSILLFLLGFMCFVYDTCFSTKLEMVDIMRAMGTMIAGIGIKIFTPKENE